MKKSRLWRRGLGAICGLIACLGGGVPVAHAAFDDPLFVLKPQPPPLVIPPLPALPPSSGKFEGACGLAVDSSGQLYVGDYYHHAVDLFGSDVGPAYPYGYQSQIAEEDPLDGPCALAVDPAGRLYVNNFHRNVVAFPTSPFGPGTVVAGVPADESHPTGLAVDQSSRDLYVDERTHLAVFDSTGTQTGEIGDFGDGHGLALSEFPGTDGYLYVPDAATETIDVYDPAVDTTEPIATIDGSTTPAGHFVSLRDTAIAVDDVSGEIYVVDNLQPAYTTHPEAVAYVFTAAGAYEGRLKFAIEDALPAGLAVDNSLTASQGRVYVTSGNTESSVVYAYRPHSATFSEVPLAFNATPTGAQGSVAAASAQPVGSVAPAVGSSVEAAAAAPPAVAGPAAVPHHGRHQHFKNRRRHLRRARSR